MYKGYDSRRERPRGGTSQASPSVLRKPMRSSHLNRRPPLRFGGQADGPSSCRLRWMSACARVVGEWRGRLQDAGGTGLEEGRQKRRDRRKRLYGRQKSDTYRLGSPAPPSRHQRWRDCPCSVYPRRAWTARTGAGGESGSAIGRCGVLGGRTMDSTVCTGSHRSPASSYPYWSSPGGC